MKSSDLKKNLDESTRMSRRGFLKTASFAAGAAGAAMFGASSVGTFLTSCTTTKEHFDTIIANGVVYCGDGKAPMKGAMVGIKDGKIVEIGKLGNLKNLSEHCKNVIDAEGLAVSPGFIDIHSHTDTNLLVAPVGDSKIYQGVTTDIGGNCGDSPFPYSDEYFASKEGTLRHGFPFWKDIDGFYNALRAKKIGINYKSYTGQGQLRSAVVGDNAVKATPEQMKKMLEILDAEMGMGSLGLSCGLEYAPGSYASNEEIAELLKVVAKHNGLFAIHMRNEDDHVEEAIAEAIELARVSGVRLQISHLKAQNAANWHKGPNMLKLIENAKAEGIDIAFDRYPYIAFSTGMNCFVPLDMRQGSMEEVQERIRNPRTEKIIAEYADSRLKRLGGPQNVLIAACEKPENAMFSGKNVAECCQLTGLEPWPMIKKILLSEYYLQMVGFAMKDENVQMFLAHELGMPASDGSVYCPEGPLSQEIPHPRSYGTFPRFFGKYVREDKICDLQTAIYKCTALPASRIGLKDRGLLLPGYAADITIFNPDTIAEACTYQQPHQYSPGIEHVIVNGVHTLEKGKFLGEFGGMIV